MDDQRARYFGDAYDCDAQATIYKWGDYDLEVLFRGRIRLDSFISRIVVIRDSSLVDGLFFWNLASRSLMEELPLERIEFRLRAETIAESILRSLVNSESTLLKPYLFDSLSTATGEHVRLELSKTRSDGISSWQQLPRLLRSLGAHDDEVGRLEAGWAGLVQLEKKYPLKRQVWPPFDFKSHLVSLLRNSKNDLLMALRIQAVREMVTKMLEAPTDVRSEVVSSLRSMREATTDNLVWSDLATVESWYIAAYNRTSAISHACDMVELSDVPGSMPVSKLQRSYDAKLSEDRIHLRYPTEFIKVLGKIQKKDFDKIMEDQETNLKLWYDKMDPTGLKKALDGLVEFLQKFGFEDNLIPKELEERTKLIGSSLGATLAAITTYEMKEKKNRRDLLKIGAAAGLGALVGGAIPLAMSEIAKKRTARTIMERAITLR
jgi:hypothetical protein